MIYDFTRLTAIRHEAQPTITCRSTEEGSGTRYQIEERNEEVYGGTEIDEVICFP